MTSDSPNYFIKDPNATLDYNVDWTSWLGTDTISVSTWIVPSGLVKASESATTKIATVWLSSGTSEQSYNVINRITTAAGRIDDRTMTILVREK